MSGLNWFDIISLYVLFSLGMLITSFLFVRGARTGEPTNFIGAGVAGIITFASFLATLHGPLEFLGIYLFLCNLGVCFVTSIVGITVAVKTTPFP